MVFMKHYEKTKQNYESGADWHAEKSGYYDWNAQIDAFVNRLQPSPRILDAGCGGSGRDIDEFRKRGMQIDGLDYSEQAIKKLREKFPDSKFIVSDLRAIALPHDSYNGVWACASVLNLSKDDVPVALSEFRRLLKTGGELFISVKEGEGEKIIPDKSGERFFSFFSDQELTKLVEGAGFSVERTEFVDEKSLTGKDLQPSPPRWICLYAIKQ